MSSFCIFFCAFFLRLFFASFFASFFPVFFIYLFFFKIWPYIPGVFLETPTTVVGRLKIAFSETFCTSIFHCKLFWILLIFITKNGLKISDVAVTKRISLSKIWCLVGSVMDKKYTSVTTYFCSQCSHKKYPRVIAKIVK